MDGFSHNVFATTSPSSVPAKEIEPPKVPSESERLEKEVNNLKSLLQQQASAADRKINEQTTSIQALKKTLEDALVALKSAKASEAKKTTVNEQWNMFNPSAKAPSEPEPKGDDMTPEEVDKIVQQKVEELARTSYQYQMTAKQKEEELVARFQSEEFKDLHKHAPKVGALWSQFAQANPQEDPDTRFQRTIHAARQMLTTNTSPLPEGGEYLPTGNSVTSPKKGPRTFNEAVGSELQQEKERHKQLEEYVSQRVRNQNTRLGFDYSRLQ